ncbi:unnamed protein product [Meganyctiphanes norvegica]|uniref:Protein kinase domain-containing protein n=1 Tax=Meganyctiphanes norvegica TaxID=48144 RepID=A0AAV2QVF3_MEGNR
MDNNGLPSNYMDTTDMTQKSRSSSPNLCLPDSWQDVLQLELGRNFTNLQPLGVGRTVKIYRAMHKDTQKMVVLKCLNRKLTSKKSFLKEFNYNYFLSNHPSILKSFNISISTSSFYVFGQEHAIGGDLSTMIVKGGFGEPQSKNLTEQITYALDFLHRASLVHRDVCLENIFVFDNCLTNVKLGDFGQTERAGTAVINENLRSSWSPPEVCILKQDEEYYADDSSDAWQMGILIFVCLTGFLPWSSATYSDRYYRQWLQWIKNDKTKIPPRFKFFSPQLMELFRCLLEPNPMVRGGLEKVYEYLNKPWLIKEINCKDMAFHDSSSFIHVTSNISSSEISQVRNVKDFLDVNSNEMFDFAKTNTSCVALGSYSQKSI